MEYILGIIKALTNNPTAPFREQAIREHILDFCQKRSIETSVDSMGNVRAVYGSQHKNRPIIFVAHMDHPGFIIEKDSRSGKTTSLFHGGVEAEYFKDSSIKIFTANGQIKGKIVKTHFDIKKKEKRVWISVDGNVFRGDLAMWDLPPCRTRGDKLYSRACDDIIGCASILAMFEHLRRRKIQRKVISLFTVAEECGLHGAKFACMKGFIPKDSVIISIETSSALPTAPIGKGVVVRVGDRASIFNPAVTDWLTKTARNLQNKNKTFKFQRKLMDAGTCEASVFVRFGYTAGAVCIPLGNYHNRSVKQTKIAPEFVSISDFENMIKLFLVLVKEGASGVQLYLNKPKKKKKRTGSMGEIFWE